MTIDTMSHMALSLVVPYNFRTAPLPKTCFMLKVIAKGSSFIEAVSEGIQELMQSLGISEKFVAV